MVMEFIKITEQPSLYNDLEKKPIGKFFRKSMLKTIK